MVWHAMKARGYAPWVADAGAIPPARTRAFLTLEVDPARLAEGGGPLVHAADLRERSVLNLSYLGKGGIGLLHRLGEVRIALTVGAGAATGTGPWRVTLDSDPARGDTALVLEDLGSGTVWQRTQAGRLTFSEAEVQALFAGRNRGGAALHPAVEWLALGSGVPIVGITAGVAPATGIATPGGIRPAGSLGSGDRVMTEAGAVPVLMARQAVMPGVGAFRPVRLLSPYFGASSDIVVPASQRVALTGADVDYLFDSAEVLAEARHLVDGITAVWDPPEPFVDWTVLLLARHHLIWLGGCATGSLFVGSLGTDHEIARRTVFGPLLAGAGLPVQARMKGRVLEPWEVRALVEARAKGRAPVSG